MAAPDECVYAVVDPDNANRVIFFLDEEAARAYPLRGDMYVVAVLASGRRFRWEELDAKPRGELYMVGPDDPNWRPGTFSLRRSVGKPTPDAVEVLGYEEIECSHDGGGGGASRLEITSSWVHTSGQPAPDIAFVVEQHATAV